MLGDLGLVFFADETHREMAEVFADVEDWDWVPEWARRKRIDELRPSFDVFCLGRSIWTMVSWNGVSESPDDHFASSLFSKCIVEEEKHCLPDAGALLKEIDTTLACIQTNLEYFKGCSDTLEDVHIEILSLLRGERCLNRPKEWIQQLPPQSVHSAYNDLARLGLVRPHMIHGVEHLRTADDHFNLDKMMTEDGKWFVEKLFPDFASRNARKASD